MGWDGSPSTTTGTNTADLMGKYFEKALLERNLPQSRLYSFAKKGTIPAGAGAMCYWTKFSGFTGKPSRLTEGVIPSSTFLTAGNISQTLYQLGKIVPVTDMLLKTSQHKIVGETLEILEEDASSSIDCDIFYRTFTDSDTDSVESLHTADLSNFMKMGGGGAPRNGFSAMMLSGVKSNIQDIFQTADTPNHLTAHGNCVNAKMSPYHILYAVSKLRASNVKPAQGQDYVMYAHPNVLMEIMLTDEWESWTKYVDREPLLAGEVGRVAGCRVLASTNIGKFNTCQLSTTNLTAYCSLIFGKDAFGAVDLQGMGGGGKPEMFVKTEGGTSNPLDQYITISYKIAFAARILDIKRGYHLISFTNV